MLVGHYSAAFFIKRIGPGLPLWVLFVAVQLSDFIHFILKFFMVEHSTVDGQNVGPLSMDLYFMPYSHSLAAAILTAALVWLFSLKFYSKTNSVLVALAVFSHWLLDFIVHTPDLPLLSDSGMKVGLGLWYFPVASYVFEVFLLFSSYLLFYRREASCGLFLLITFMIGFQTIFSLLMAPPENPILMSLVAVVTYTVFAFLVYRLENRIGCRPFLSGMSSK